MKVLLVNGSPHKEGCTYTALSEVAAALNKEGIETEMFWIGNRPIGGCIACKVCVKLGQCVFDDVVNICRKKAYDGGRLCIRYTGALCRRQREHDRLYGQIILFGTPMETAIRPFG